MYRKFVKRLVDLFLAVIILVVLSPVALLLFVLVRQKLGSPVFFVQARPGLFGKLFRMVKFRTMTNARRPDGTLLPDAERLPAFGRFLRATSLDELPELWNVIKGEMSLVGPRPLLEEYLPLYNKSQAQRHNVRPGITGWAQVNGRNAISWEQKFELDAWYVNNMSFLLDMKILFRTIGKVFRSEGISSASAVTMEKFTGTK